MIDPAASDEWYSPLWFLEKVVQWFEACSDNGDKPKSFDPTGSRYSPAGAVFDDFVEAEENCLDQYCCWPLQSNFYMNQPYSNPWKFGKRFLNEYAKNVRRHAINLVNCASSTKWWHKMADKADHVCFVTPRIKFWRVRLTEEELRSKMLKNPAPTKEQLNRFHKELKKEMAMDTVWQAHGRELIEPGSPRYESVIFGFGQYVGGQYDPVAAHEAFVGAFGDMGFIPKVWR